MPRPRCIALTLAASLALLSACTGPPPGPQPEPLARVRPVADELRPLAFQPAAVRDGPLALTRLGDQLLLVTHEASFVIDEQGGLAATDLPRPEAADQYIAPFHFWPKGGYWLHPYELAGRWPDGVWALFNSTGHDRVRAPRVILQRKGQKWVHHDTVAGEGEDEVEWSYQSIFAWTNGQVLGLRLEGTRWRARDVLDGYAAPEKRPAARFDVLGDRIEPAWPQIDPELILVAAAAANSALFLVGYKGEVGDRRVFVQRWAANGPPAGVLDELPGNFTVHRLVVAAADHAYVAGEQTTGEAAYLAEFDGTTWSSGHVPAGKRIRDLAVAPGGDLWAIVELDSETVLVRQHAGSTWDRVALSALDLPPGERWQYDKDDQPARIPRTATGGRSSTRPVRVEARGDDDVWVLAEVDDRDVLFRSVALATRPVVIPSPGRLSAAREDAKPAEPWRPGMVCLRGVDPFVPLATIPAGTAEDAEIPVVETFIKDAAAVRTFFKGIYEFDDKGRRVVGMFVREDIPAPKLKRLRTALQRAAPDEPHDFVCRRPPILRAFDPATGKPEAP